MKTVTIDVQPLTNTLGDFTQTWKSGKASAPRISFESPDLLFKVLSGKRWELLNTRFHECLVNGHDSPWTLRVLRTLARQGERYRRYAIGLPDSGRDVHAEHRELFELATAGNEARAALALEAHIRTTPEMLIRAMRAGQSLFGLR